MVDPLKGNGIIPHDLPGHQGGTVGIVAAQFKGHGLSGMVRHRMPLGDGIPLQREGDVQREAEGVDRQRVGAVPGAEGHSVCALGHDLKLPFPAEAVHGGRDHFPVQFVLLVDEPPDQREQCGRVAPPDSGISLPDTLHAVQLQTGQLCAPRIDLGRQDTVFQCDHIVHIIHLALCCRMRSSSSFWACLTSSSKARALIRWDSWPRMMVCSMPSDVATRTR